MPVIYGFVVSIFVRDGSGLIFSGSGRALISYFGLGLFRA